MNWPSLIRTELAAAGHEPDDDVVEELAQHAGAMYAAARAEGLSHDAAARQVHAQVVRWREDAGRLRHRTRRAPAVAPPSVGTASWLEGLAQDVRYAARLLRRHAKFTSVAVLTMALGIGATTALFSVAYGVLMKPLPWPDAERLVILKETRGGNAPRFNSFSNAAYLAWRSNAATLDSIAAWSQHTTTLTGIGDAERIRITAASASLFGVLGARPLIGSFFTEADELPGTTPVVVISEALWRGRFGADPRALGRVIQLDGQPHTIVGVLPVRLAYPDARSVAWVPFHVTPSDGNSLSLFDAVARLRPGATAAQAGSEATARGRSLAINAMTIVAMFGGTGPVGVTAVPLKEAMTADVRPALIVLLAGVVLLLFTATANVAGLQLARAITRRREVAIRAALGAGAARVVRQMLAENLALGAIGGLAGLLVASLLYRIVPALLPADFPRSDDVALDVVSVAFALSLALLTSAVFGLLPALHATRLDLTETLNENGNARVGGAGRATAVGRARMAIMSSQVAAACVLLVGASLLGRSFVTLLHTDRGYDPSGVIIARVSMPESVYTPARRHDLLGSILDRLTSIPGVTDAAFTSELPLTPGGSTSSFTLPHRGKTLLVQASPRIVSARAFPALGMRIVEGRGFTGADTEASLPVVVVNRAFARKYLDGDAIGVTLPMAVGYGVDGKDATIVGVAEDVRYTMAGGSSQPEMYYCYRQFNSQLPVPVVTLLLRSGGDLAPLKAGVRSAVREVDRTLVPEAVMTMEERLLLGLARPRLYSMLIGGFAALALVVAAVGLFGVLTQIVGQRSRELAVRSALGARPSDIMRLVLGQGLAIAAIGCTGGMCAAAVLVRSVSTVLYGVTPYDAITFVTVPAVLLLVTGAVCVLPARRAARMDPVQVLRSS